MPRFGHKGLRYRTWERLLPPPLHGILVAARLSKTGCILEAKQDSDI